MRSYEHWKPVIGYRGRYEVSSLGRVRSVKRKITLVDGRVQVRPSVMLTPTVDPKGPPYPYVTLSKPNSRKRMRVHNLVLEAFRGSRPKGQVCRHLDGNPSNNRLINLAWGTYTENFYDREEHGNGCSKKVRRDDGAVFYSIKDAARSVGVTSSAITKALRTGGRSGGYRWRYYEPT